MPCVSAPTLNFLLALSSANLCISLCPTFCVGLSTSRKSFDFANLSRHIRCDMSTQEMLLEEIKKQPEPVLREVLHYLQFLARQRKEDAWADILPGREI